MDSGRYILGPEVVAFEEEFAAFCGARHCLGVASGTDALVLALTALGAGPERPVWTAANAGFYTATAAGLVGAPLRFFDVDPATALPPADLVLPLAAAGQIFVATHLYGNAVDEAVFRAARAKGMSIVEDCSQAHGARVSGKPVGSLGDVAAFSFYPTKNLGAFGDGGAIVTSDDGLAAELALLRQYGWSPKYVVTRERASNSRLDEVQASMLRVSLALLPDWNRRRRDIGAAYAKTAAGARLLTRHGENDATHLAVLTSERRDAVREQLKTLGIATDIHYPVPDHQQPAIGRRLDQDVSLPVTERLARTVFSVPLYPELTDEEVRDVCSALDQVS